MAGRNDYSHLDDLATHKTLDQGREGVSRARIISERRREAAETEARRGCSQARTTQAYSLRYVEEAERERPRRARGSVAAVDV